MSGRVQGVGFRYWTVQRAAALGIRGTVRNLADGTVAVVAEGDDARLAKLRSLLLRGPRGAAVERVAEETAGNDPLPAGFEIRY